MTEIKAWPMGLKKKVVITPEIAMRIDDKLAKHRGVLQ